MIDFPNAKINIGLKVLGKRTDGYHDISSCLVPIGVYDILEINESNDDSFTITGLEIPGQKEDNLVWKAYTALKEAHNLPPVSIHLHKIIPMGAGLGGGSSDGAFALSMLNTLFQLNLNSTQLLEYAAALGSDCSFFIKSGSKLASGRGEILSPIELDLEKRFSVTLVHPSFSVSTSDAYSNVKYTQSDDLLESLLRDVVSWRGSVFNDFEEYVFDQKPELKKIKEALYESGALFASMTGSGSTFFGLFDKNKKSPDLSRLSQYSIQQNLKIL